MADTVRTFAALQALLADNVTGDISPQDVRDFLASVYNWVNASAGGGNISYAGGEVHIGADDTTQAILKLYGGASGVPGKLLLYNAANTDTNEEYWTMQGSVAEATGRFLNIGPASDFDRFQMSTTGSSGASGEIRINTASDKWIGFTGLGGGAYFSNGTVGQSLYLRVSGATTLDTEAVTILSTGNVGIGASPTAKLDVNSDIFRLRTAKTPATAGAAGNAGDICWDASNIYVCVATNTWKKIGIATW